MIPVLLTEIVQPRQPRRYVGRHRAPRQPRLATDAKTATGSGPAAAPAGPDLASRAAV